MGVVELLLVAVGLSMDAFSVSVCKGMSAKRFSWCMALTCGLWFGVFQALMPLIGYFLGSQFQLLIESVDHWIAFGLLFLIGVNMIRDAIWGNGDRRFGAALDFRTMFFLALATSIDALAVGVSFACVRVQIWLAVLIIGITTSLFSVLGVKIGNMFGSKLERLVGIVGGIILIVIGLKILLEHLCVIGF